MWKNHEKSHHDRSHIRWILGTCPQQRALGHRVAAPAALAQHLQLLKAKVPGPVERSAILGGIAMEKSHGFC